MRTSFMANCQENIHDCYASIGGVEWLPGLDYLKPTDGTTKPYLEYGLCNPMSSLYNPMHCEKCDGWKSKVLTMQWMIAIILEHMLLLLKMVMAHLIPDTPKWIVDANARAAFRKEMDAKPKRDRQSTAAEMQEEWMERQAALAKIDPYRSDGQVGATEQPEAAPDEGMGDDEGEDVLTPIIRASIGERGHSLERSNSRISARL